ncbi:MAG: VOC family protein [Thermocrispum sp.]
MDNVGIVLDDLDAAVAFFLELGLELEGRGSVRVMQFHRPAAVSIESNAPGEHPGHPTHHVRNRRHPRRPFRLRAHGAELIGEIVQYEDLYLLCYVRGPEGVILALAQELR